MVDDQASNRARVLIADDHAVVRSGISNALKDVPNIEIVGEVGDGRAVLRALASMPVDCLLTDVAMPEFEPVATIRYIRECYPDLKILVVSAYDDDEYVQGLFGAGVNGYHLKDQPLNDLRLAVQRILVGGRWLSDPLVEKLTRERTTAGTGYALTQRQRDILQFLQQGLDNQAIARQLGVSVKTVENHLTRLYRHLNVQSRLEAVSFATQHATALRLAETSNGAQAHPARIAKQLRLLVIDDNPRFRRQLLRMVSNVCPDAMLYEAANVREAVQVFREALPQLVLVDVVLGDDDGIRCTRELRAISAAARIILISAYPDREFHRLGLEAGAIAFLDKKDLNSAALRQVIEDVQP